MSELCHCGEPLHYSREYLKDTVNGIIKVKGNPNVDVVVGDKSYSVPLHYIALHGIHGSTIHEQGFEVKDAV